MWILLCYLFIFCSQAKDKETQWQSVNAAFQARQDALAVLDELEENSRYSNYYILILINVTILIISPIHPHDIDQYKKS